MEMLGEEIARSYEFHQRGVAVYSLVEPICVFLETEPCLNKCSCIANDASCAKYWSLHFLCVCGKNQSERYTEWFHDLSYN